MPTHWPLQCTESPDGRAQDTSGAPEPASSMTPHAAPACMFCEQTFSRQDELGPHVLTQHPTSLYEPAVLRVEAEFRIPGERARAQAGGPAVPREEVRRCIVCGLVGQDAAELESHMRKHKDYFSFCCSVCGRRFREPWFLKTHMKMHAKAGSKSRAQPDPEAPVTVNGVLQDPSAEPVVTRYKMCMVCGFFFPDHEALVEHSKVHNRELDPGKEGGGGEGEGASVTQKRFLHSLGLLPQPHGRAERSSRWIPQLDPFNTYQAWQLATRGKLAVGPHTSKDPSQEASTDNEECSSDKDECASSVARAPTELLAPGPPPGPETRRRCLMQRVKEKERPTSCEDCQRTFRTYHQLVLHSRIHKRERSGEESPTSADRKFRLEQAEEGCEEGFVEAMLSENLGAGEDGLGQTKARSKECNYCGKSFRSSYYLTIHLRTHTGEKPYKCLYCDYAAAQKTSLKYHLDRHHKDKRCAEIPSRPIASPVDAKPGEDAEIPAESGAGAPDPAAAAAACSCAASDDSCESLDDKSGNPLLQINLACQKLIPMAASSRADDKAKRPTPVNPEKDELEEEAESDVPLNLSLKVSLSVPPSAVVPASCPFCAYKSFYPEVLSMHKRLVHKDKPVKKNGFGGLKQKRLTGCPPALKGKDVAPLPTLGRRHPRRTTSPLRPAAKPGEKLPADPALAPKRSPGRAPVQETQHQGEAAPPQPPSRKPFSGSRPVLERPGAPDRYPRGRGVAWCSDAARLCLSSQFGPLPPMDFGEPSSKRFKYMAAARRDAGAGVLRGPVGAGSSRLLMPGRGGKTTSQPPPDSLGPSKTPAAVGGSLDCDWSMMNLLSSCSANELASLYPSAPPPPAHAGLANPRAGGITVLYQHLPALPSLQRRDPAALFPTQRYGTADKSA